MTLEFEPPLLASVRDLDGSLSLHFLGSSSLYSSNSTHKWNLWPCDFQFVRMHYLFEIFMVCRRISCAGSYIGGGCLMSDNSGETFISKRYLVYPQEVRSSMQHAASAICKPSLNMKRYTCCLDAQHCYCFGIGFQLF